MRKKYHIYGLFLFLLMPCLAASDLMVSVVPQPLVAGEPAQLSLSSSKGYPVIQQLPQVEGIVWENGIQKRLETRIINFKREESAKTIYTFRPEKEGKITIPPIKITLADKKVLSDPLELNVISRRYEAGDGDGGTSKAVELKDMLFEKIDVLSDKKEFYVGEEIPLEIKIYAIQGLNVDLSWPLVDAENAVFKDFGKENRENDKFSPYTQSTSRINGQIFNVFSFRTALRPIAHGKLNLKAIENCQVRIPGKERDRGNSFFDDDSFFDGFFSSTRHRKTPYRLSAELKDVNVKQLPAPPSDANFLGLIGNWHVKTKLSTETFKVGEPVTLTLNIRGNGSLETLKAPQLSMPGFRLYPPEMDKSSLTGGGMQKAEIRYVMIPVQEGKAELSLNPSVFQCTQGEYKEYPFKKEVNVAKSDNGSSSASLVMDSSSEKSGLEQVRHEKTERKLSVILYPRKSFSGDVCIPLWENHIVIFVLLFVLAPLAWGINEIAFRRRARLCNDPSLRRKTAALNMRGAILRKIKKASPGELDIILQKELVPYLNDILSLPPGTSAPELASIVKDPELAECLTHIGDSSYMPGVSSMDKNELKTKIYKSVKKFAAIILLCALPFGAYGAAMENTSQPKAVSVKKIEKKKAIKNPAESKVLKVQPDMAPKTVKPEPIPQPLVKPITNADEALIAYDEGRFADAAVYYRSKLNPHSPDPSLLYNIGNCYCQMGDYARALVCYERAVRLAPGASDIFENMNFVRRKLLLQEKGKAENPLQLLINLREYLRPDQWMFLAFVGWAAGWLAFASRRIFRGEKWKILLAVSIAIIIVSAVAFFSQERTSYSPDNAVIIGKNVPVYSLPSEKSGTSEFRLKAGDEVRIEEQRMNWARVRADNVSGWIDVKDVARIWGDWGTL